ncbi:MAG: hypothetical protein WC603_00165 [Candidatus Paceibacterota bacterium]|jgi:hypothetical protein
MIYAIILAVIVILFLLFRPRRKKIGEVGQHWNHFFPNFQFSSAEFYSLVEEKIKAQAMPNTRISRVNYAESSIISNRREYLHIERKEDIFDICAAPFGTGFFVSYWLGKPKHAFRNFLSRIPYLSQISEGWQGSTYYLADTASMFRGAVVSSISEAIEEITTRKGLRGLSESEQFAMVR